MSYNVQESSHNKELDLKFHSSRLANTGLEEQLPDTIKVYNTLQELKLKQNRDRN